MFLYNVTIQNRGRDNTVTLFSFSLDHTHLYCNSPSFQDLTLYFTCDPFFLLSLIVLLTSILLTTVKPQVNCFSCVFHLYPNTQRVTTSIQTWMTTKYASLARHSIGVCRAWERNAWNPRKNSNRHGSQDAGRITRKTLSLHANQVNLLN